MVVSTPLNEWKFSPNSGENKNTIVNWSNQQANFIISVHFRCLVQHWARNHCMIWTQPIKKNITWDYIGSLRMPSVNVHVFAEDWIPNQGVPSATRDLLSSGSIGSCFTRSFRAWSSRSLCFRLRLRPRRLWRVLRFTNWFQGSFWG